MYYTKSRPLFSGDVAPKLGFRHRTPRPPKSTAVLRVEVEMEIFSEVRLQNTIDKLMAAANKI
jgi:hypothetical protein